MIQPFQLLDDPSMKLFRSGSRTETRICRSGRSTWTPLKVRFPAVAQVLGHFLSCRWNPPVVGWFLDPPGMRQAADCIRLRFIPWISFGNERERVFWLAYCSVLPSWNGTSRVQAEPPGEPGKLAEYFGFQPIEIYKLERRIANLQIKDLDGDKIGDIIVGNNARSRIDLLLSSKKPAEEAEGQPFRKEANHLDFDRRMRLVSVPVNKEVVSVDTGDFNGDGKPDLVYYGTPAEVEILFNEGAGRFGNARKISTGDAVAAAGALAVGDIDQDGRDDIVLLAENDLIFVYQTAPECSVNPSACLIPQVIPICSSLSIWMATRPSTS